MSRTFSLNARSVNSHCCSALRNCSHLDLGSIRLWHLIAFQSLSTAPLCFLLKRTMNICSKCTSYRLKIQSAWLQPGLCINSQCWLCLNGSMLTRRLYVPSAQLTVRVLAELFVSWSKALSCRSVLYYTSARLGHGLLFWVVCKGRFYLAS
jgi:hypothetical protein